MIKDIKLDDDSEIYKKFDSLRVEAGFSTMKAAILAAMKTILIRGFLDWPNKPQEDGDKEIYGG